MGSTLGSDAEDLDSGEGFASDGPRAWRVDRLLSLPQHSIGARGCAECPIRVPDKSPQYKTC